jgi:hypothetical protein
LFTRGFAVDGTANLAERGAKAARRHQAVSGYWHSLATLARWYASAATWIRPPSTASPHSTPSTTQLLETRAAAAPGNQLTAGPAASAGSERR